MLKRFKALTNNFSLEIVSTGKCCKGKGTPRPPILIYLQFKSMQKSLKWIGWNILFLSALNRLLDESIAAFFPFPYFLKLLLNAEITFDIKFSGYDQTLLRVTCFLRYFYFRILVFENIHFTDSSKQLIMFSTYKSRIV